MKNEKCFIKQKLAPKSIQADSLRPGHDLLAGFMNGERGKKHIVNNLIGYHDASLDCGGSAGPMQIPRTPFSKENVPMNKQTSSVYETKIKDLHLK